VSGYRVRRLWSLGPVLGLVAAWCLFAALAGESFAGWPNQRLMLLQTTVVGTAAVGATLVIVSGGIDLSVGSTIALVTVVVALLLRAGWSPTAAAAGGVLAGGACGLAIGAVVDGYLPCLAAAGLAAALAGRAAAGLGPPASAAVAALAFAAVGLLLRRRAPRVPLAPFLVTLGAFGALRGLAKGLGDNQPVYPGDTGWIADLMHGGASVLGLPGGAWILLGTAALVALLLRRTRFGLHALAVGSNEETARLCGVPIERTKLLVYATASACAGLAGLLQLSYLSMGDPTTATGHELKVIAAAVIGGASLAGGEGSVAGTLVGAFVMTVVDNGCTKLGLDNWVQEIVTGGIIVAAVALDRLRRR